MPNSNLKVRFVNPATITPIAVAIPAAVVLAISEGPDWLLPVFGLSFILALGITIPWLPIVGSVLFRLPGRRFAPLVLVVGCFATALAFGGFGMLIHGFIPHIGDVPMWLAGTRFACVGAYFGLIATSCLYVDPDFRSTSDA
ncbi:MAG: hypothetical protein IPK97_20935 [Ahniella sp.]|nr:hypothetical protein [Ahniella sp.]